MKTITFSLCTVLFCALMAFTAKANLLRVNNNAGVNAPYTTAQAAHDAALVGDTIMIEHSGASYGNLNISKNLVIIGAGYFLDQNIGLQWNQNSSTVGTINIAAPASGLHLTGLTTGAIAVNGANNITLKRNYIRGTLNLNTAAHTINIHQNYFLHTADNNYSLSSDATVIHSISVRNNIFRMGINLGTSTSGIFEHNVMDPTGYSSCATQTGNRTFSLHNFQVRNNIIARNTYQLAGCGFVNFSTNWVPNNCTPVENNVATGTQFGNLNGNIQNAVNLFVATGTSDGQYQLGGASPAIGAGTGGVNCGPFGGSDPYKLSGIPTFPTIYNLVVPSNSITNTLNITISTRGNN